MLKTSTFTGSIENPTSKLKEEAESKQQQQQQKAALMNQSPLVVPQNFRVPDIIMKKRNGLDLTEHEIAFFVRAICDRNNNAIQESQVGAFLMAVYFRSMSFDESFMFTKEMIKSGERFNWPSHYKSTMVDKHSTGGVGDKISLPLAPALAACGLRVPMISGRGLGFTGGTLDKLESIPGFRVSQSKKQIEELIATVGCCIVGQTAELNPADRILYATRDITCTVDCVPMIAGSIVSKKAIEDLDALVLDVKVGRAAFMKSQPEAEQLADYMLEICRKLGFKAGVFLTRHDDPIGHAIGNSLEIEETIECLHGEMASDIEELVTKYGGYLLQRTRNAATMKEGAARILETLKNGEALAKFQAMLVAQGVDEHVAHRLCVERDYAGVFGEKQKAATFMSTIKARESGYVESIDALELGLIASSLGAGRAKAGDSISYEVGFKLLKKSGDKIESDEPWATVYHNCTDLNDKYGRRLLNSISISKEFVARESSVIKIRDFD